MCYLSKLIVIKRKHLSEVHFIHESIADCSSGKIKLCSDFYSLVKMKLLFDQKRCLQRE